MRTIIRPQNKPAQSRANPNQDRRPRIPSSSTTMSKNASPAGSCEPARSTRRFLGGGTAGRKATGFREALGRAARPTSGIEDYNEAAMSFQSRSEERGSSGRHAAFAERRRSLAPSASADIGPPPALVQRRIAPPWQTAVPRRLTAGPAPSVPPPSNPACRPPRRVPRPGRRARAPAPGSASPGTAGGCAGSPGSARAAAR